MKKENKKLVSYLLALVMSITTVFSNGMVTQAAVLFNDTAKIKETTENIIVAKNNGKTVYSLNGDITNGLQLTLTDGETAVLDGNGYTITGKAAYYDKANKKSIDGTPALTVNGSGTLEIRNATFQGGNNDDWILGANGIVVNGDVNVVLKYTVNIVAGSAAAASTEGETGKPGNIGLEFLGKNLTIDEKANVMISASKGYDGYKSLFGAENGNTGGDALVFEGEKFVIAGGLILNGGTGGKGAYSSEYEMYSNAGDGGNALVIKTGLGSLKETGSVSFNGGVAGELPKAFEGDPKAEEYVGKDGLKLFYEGGLFEEGNLLEAIGVSANEILVKYPDTDYEPDRFYIPNYENIKIKESELFSFTQKEKMKLLGWYSDEACTQAFDFDVPITEDVTVYAKLVLGEYTVSFNSVGGSDVTSQVVEWNCAAQCPENPEKEGHTFVGWYSDEACTQAYDFETPVTNDIHLYAKWDINKYSVSFNSVGGSEVTSQTVKWNEKTQCPENPEKEGYTFVGWYTDEACTQAYDFETPVKNDIYLYAKWTKKIDEEVNPGQPGNPGQPENPGQGKEESAVKKNYTVSFDVAGGSKIEAQSVEEGKKAVLPTAPTKKNCGFGGWYTDKECTKEYNFDSAVNSDVQLYAKWYTVKVNASTITLQKGKSTSEVKATVLKGDSIASFKSSNKKIATVKKNGKITGKEVGKTTITVKTKKGAKATFTVKVQNKKVTTKKITVTNVKKKSLTLKKGKSFTLKTELNPITSQDKITYSSSNKKVATVTKKGKIKAVKKGKAVITVKSGSKKVKITVKVTK